MSTPGTAPFLIPAPELTDAANIETAIEPLRDRIEAVLAQFLVPIGGLLAYAGAGDPAGGSWLLADGRLIDRTVFASFFAAVGHAYNGGVDPGSNKVRLPDKRGRGSIGADDMAGTRAVDPTTGVAYASPGAAGRLPNSNRARGQNGGEERHTLIRGELPALQVWNEIGVGSQLQVATSTFYGPYNGNVGGPGGHNNLHPYEIDNMIVRVA